MANQAALFHSLLNQRDLAAYRLVAAVETVLRFWEAQDYESARALLERSRTEFECADARINQFCQSIDPQGEFTRHAY